MRDRIKSKWLLVIIVGLVVAITGSAGLILATAPVTHRPTVAVTRAQPRATRLTYIRYQGQSDQNALSLLKTRAMVITKDAPHGSSVVSINGVGDGKHWQLYVNGRLLPSSNADSYVTKPSDTVEWKLE